MSDGTRKTVEGVHSRENSRREISRTQEALENWDRLLSARSDLLSHAFEAVAGLIYDWDVARGTCQRSPGLVQLLGFEPGEDEPTPTWWSDRIHPDDMSRLNQIWEQATERRADVVETRYRIRHKDGRWIWIDDRVRVVRDSEGRPIRGVGASRDVTFEVTQSETISELTREKDRLHSQLHALFMGATVGLALFDERGRYVMINEHLAAINGVPAQDHIGRTIADVLPQLAPLVDPLLYRVLERNEVIEDLVVEGETPQQPGVMRVWEDGWFPVRGSDGKPVGVGVVVKEITQQRLVQEALQRSEASLRLLTDVMPQLVWRADAAGQLTFVSSQWQSVTGQTQQEASGFGWADVIHPEDRERVVGQIRASIASGTEYESDHRIRVRDGGYRWYLSRALPVRDATGQPVMWIGTSTDIEDRKRAEEVLARDHHALERLVAERMAAAQRLQEQLRFDERLTMMGGLAAGLGHDLANLLAPIRIRMDSLSSTLDERSRIEAADDFVAIRDSLQYLQRLAQGLRMLSIDPAGAKRTARTALPQWWESCEPLLRSLLPRHVELVGTGFEHCPDAAIAPSTLLQVVFNLVQNAGEAMRDQSGGLVQIEGSQRDDGVCIAVRDNGPGMAPEILHRCMEPFVSSKPASSAGGLGLALVKRYVAAVGGSLHVKSVIGDGTVFEICLPRADADIGDEPLRTALVNIKSPLVRAAVERELAAMAFEIARPSPGEGAQGHLSGRGIDVEVADSVSVASGEARCLVLLREPWSPVMPANVHAIGANFSASMLRVVLREIAGEEPG